jgi:alpha-L-fucosidase
MTSSTSARTRAAKLSPAAMLAATLSSKVTRYADFTTPEYTQYGSTQDFAWETTRGMGTSYGYNRQETDADYASFEQTLFPGFVSAVSRNGRLLLNVGPAGGRGRIPPEQRRRLEAFGAWLDAKARRYGARILTRSPGRPPRTACRSGSPARPAGSTPSSSGVRPARWSGSRAWSCPRHADACSATAAW